MHNNLKRKISGVVSILFLTIYSPKRNILLYKIFAKRVHSFNSIYRIWRLIRCVLFIHFIHFFFQKNSLWILSYQGSALDYWLSNNTDSHLLTSKLNVESVSRWGCMSNEKGRTWNLNHQSANIISKIRFLSFKLRP